MHVALPPERRDRLLADICALATGRVEPVETAARWRRETEPDHVVTAMQFLVRAAVRLKFGLHVPLTEGPLAGVGTAALTAWVEGIEFRSLFSLADRLGRARADVQSATGFNEQLLLEDLAIGLTEAAPPGDAPRVASVRRGSRRAPGGGGGPTGRHRRGKHHGG